MVEQARRKEGGPMGAWTFAGRLIVVLAAVVVIALLVKRAITPEHQLQAVLDAETAALSRGDWEAFVALQDPQDPEFRRYQRSSFDSFLSARQRREPMVQPVLPVVEVGRRGDQAWALLKEEPQEESEGGPARIEFFRRLYGQWLHTGPDPDHWGAPQELRSEHITWTYREADEGQVTRLALFAETLHQQVCDDLSLDPQERRLVINVCYSLDCAYVVYPHDRVIGLPTPLLFGLGEQDLQYTLANLMAGDLVRRAAGLDAEGSAMTSRILNGIEGWEVAQAMGETPGGDSLLALRSAVASGTLLTLQELDQPVIRDAALLYDQAYTLVEYTVSQYGRQVLSALARAAGRQAQARGPSAGVTATLQEALGAELDLASFEAGWLAFIHERYGE